MKTINHSDIFLICRRDLENANSGKTDVDKDEESDPPAAMLVVHTGALS